MTRIFGNIPDLAGNIPDLAGSFPDLKFASLVTFRTSTDEVRNITKIPWCFSGPRPLRSGILPVAPGKIPDLTHRGPEYYQDANLRSGILPARSGILPARSGKLPKILVTFRTSHNEVRNLTSLSWYDSGLRTTRSGMLPVCPGKIPDLN